MEMRPVREGVKPLRDLPPEVREARLSEAVEAYKSGTASAVICEQMANDMGVLLSQGTLYKALRKARVVLHSSGKLPSSGRRRPPEPGARARRRPRKKPVVAPQPADSTLMALLRLGQEMQSQGLDHLSMSGAGVVYQVMLRREAGSGR